MDARTPRRMDSAVDTKVISRRHPLHTFGVSLAAIAEIALTKSKDFGRLGSVVKLITAVASARPFSTCTHSLKYLCLAALFFTDRYILVIENMIENLFPSSVFVFDKIDDLVQIVEVLPREFDDVINKFPVIFHQVPLLDYAVGRVISWLKGFISLLTEGSTKEKEITIDISYQQLNTDPASSSSSPPVHELHGPASDIKCENEKKSSTQSDVPQTETVAYGLTTKVSARESGFMDVLEKGTIENSGTKDDDTMEEVVSEKAENKNIESKEAVSMGKIGSDESKGDDHDAKKQVAEEILGKEATALRSDDDLVLVEKVELLELFESSWHASPTKWSK